ncbi:MAG: hypothetical protein QMD22_01275, partial [archaeon]|nr:hypothetical protein [archaeon]
MVTREAKSGGRLVVELDDSTYRAIAGKILSLLPPHVYVSPERTTSEAGKKVVRLWSRYPGAAKKAVQKALGE